MRINLQPDAIKAWYGALPDDFQEAMPGGNLSSDTLVTEAVSKALEDCPEDASMRTLYEAIAVHVVRLTQAERVRLIAGIASVSGHKEYLKLIYFLDELAEQEGDGGGASLIIKDLSEIALPISIRMEQMLGASDILRTIQEAAEFVGSEDEKMEIPL